MEWDPEKVAANIRQADTDDLLDRATAYRQGIEPEALALIDEELRRRGVAHAAIESRLHDCRLECLFHPDGAAMMCSFCGKPSVARAWGWHTLWQMIPLFPRRLRYCQAHQATSFKSASTSS